MVTCESLQLGLPASQRYLLGFFNRRKVNTEQDTSDKRCPKHKASMRLDTLVMAFRTSWDIRAFFCHLCSSQTNEDRTCWGPASWSCAAFTVARWLALDSPWLVNHESHHQSSLSIIWVRSSHRSPFLTVINHQKPSKPLSTIIKFGKHLPSILKKSKRPLLTIYKNSFNHQHASLSTSSSHHRSII